MNQDPSLQPLTPEIARKAMAQFRRAIAPSDEEGVKAFNAGRHAKRHGQFRVSPYYNKPFLDAAWLRGFDEQAAPSPAIIGPHTAIEAIKNARNTHR
jgi:hypothetical protein